MLSLQYSILADLAMARNDIRNAFERHQEALSMTEGIDKELHLANIYSATGLLFRKIGQDDTAVYWWMKALELNKKCHDIYGIARESRFISKVFVDKGELDKALEFRRDALKMHSILKDDMAILDDNAAIESSVYVLQRRTE